MERVDCKKTKVSDTFVLIKRCLTPLLSLILFLAPLFYTDAVAPIYNYVASSTGYRIVDDMISVGGILGTSTSYNLQDSVSGLGFETSTSTAYSVKSGHIPMSESYLAVSVPANIALSPSINAVGGGTGNGSASWTVITDSTGGYSLSIKASTAPALKSASNSFGNYSTQVAGIPDYSLTEGSGADFFGFTPEGNDIATLYKDDGASACNTGSNDTADKCWDSITTSNKTIATGAANHPSGVITTVKFRAEAGSLVRKTAGSYSATITVTALAL